MALEIHFDGLIQSWAVTNAAELARHWECDSGTGDTDDESGDAGSEYSGGVVVSAAVGTGAG